MDRMKLDLNAPHTVYRDKDGKRLVGVTTITGAIPKDLMGYAANQEREGVRGHVLGYVKQFLATGTLVKYECIEDAFSGLPKAFFHVGATKKAADFGTVAHAHIEAYNKGTELSPEGLDEKVWEAAKAPLRRWIAWLDEEGLEVVESEAKLVHPDLHYGGTIDTVLSDRHGLLVLADIKTTGPGRKWPYPNVKAQVCGGYAPMYERVRGVKLDRCMAYRVGKTEDDPGERRWFTDKERADSVRLFLAAREMYEALRTL